MTKDKKIGFFGGSFDPFHLGHLNLAIEVKEKTDLEEIWICPAYQSPFKKEASPEEISHRVEMIRKSIEGISYLKVIDIEAKKKEISYTYDTLNALKEKGAKLTLILSDDLIYDFDKWKNSKNILTEFECLIALREHYQIDPNQVKEWVYKQIKNKILPIRLIDTCSSEIRKRLKNKLCCNHLLSSKTLDYICKYKLYS